MQLAATTVRYDPIASQTDAQCDVISVRLLFDIQYCVETAVRIVRNFHILVGPHSDFL